MADQNPTAGPPGVPLGLPPPPTRIPPGGRLGWLAGIEEDLKAALKPAGGSLRPLARGARPARDPAARRRGAFGAGVGSRRLRRGERLRTCRRHPQRSPCAAVDPRLMDTSAKQV